jgi:glycolate oxidase iron-sulfur subunit
LLSRLLSGEKAEAERPVAQANRLPSWDPTAMPPIVGEVYLLEGCAMRVLFPRVHEATRRLLRRVGYTVREVDQGCCGALHAHGGLLDEAQTMAHNLMSAFHEPLPIVVNSAGCGSTMKHYDQLIATPQAVEFGHRVFDISQFLLKNGLAKLLTQSPGVDETVTYHDACHLAHGQAIRSEPRELIQSIPRIRFQELTEADTCCGSAGTYNITQPKMARKLVERKYHHIERTGASIVATGNPGCHAWIAQVAREHGAKTRVLHTAELLEASFSGLPDK